MLSISRESHAEPKAQDGIQPILELLRRIRRVDFSGYVPALLERQIRRRMTDTGCADLASYRASLLTSPDEVDRLLEALTVKVSSFFREPFSFAYLSRCILPPLMAEKDRQKSAQLRVWSAGCSFGAEPYSVAMLIHELREEAALQIDSSIFGTDIDQGILRKAEEGNFSAKSIENVTYRQLKTYFQEQDGVFRLDPRIKAMVSFSMHNLLDTHTYAPPESVFGAFDIILCCNVLIYLGKEGQEAVFEKLYHALARDGYLVLGEVESPPPRFAGSFRPVCDCCHIYRKQ